MIWLTLHFSKSKLHYFIKTVKHKILRFVNGGQGSGGHVGGGHDPGLEECGGLPVGDGVAQSGNELQGIFFIVNNMEVVTKVHLDHIQVVTINKRVVDKPGLSDLLQTILQVAVGLGLVPPDVQVGLGTVLLQAGIHQVEIRPGSMCASEPESLTLKIMKAFKSLDLLDYNGRLLVLGLAPSISHKCRRNLHIESSGNYWDDINNQGASLQGWPWARPSR